MSFQEPWILFFLIIPVLLAVWEWFRDSQAIPMPFDGVRVRSRDRFMGCLVRSAHLIPLLLLSVAIIVLSGPRRLGPPESDRMMTNILFALDLSGSMGTAFGSQTRLAGDGVTIAGVNTIRFDEGKYTRYHAALESMNEFAKIRKGDAFGLTFFGTEFIHWLPVTRDISALQYSASLLHPNSMPRWFAGTRIANALHGCVDRMKMQPSGDKLLIVITDGESQDFMNNADIIAANALRDAGIITYFISINPDVLSESMRTIAAMTGGEALTCGDKKGLERIFRHIDHMEKAKMVTRHPEMVDYNAPFAVAGGILLALSVLSLFGMRFTPW